MTKMKATGIALLCVIILSFYFIFPHIAISWRDTQTASPGDAATTKQKTASLPGINPAGQGKVWVCPMHPEIMQDHPGTCPICGMELVESKSHEAHGHGVHVDSASIQKLGVRLASVKISPVSQEVRVYGNVTADESALYEVHSNFDGWIRKSYIHSVGQHIEKGQVIYEIYSPELIMQQKEYLKFVERRNQILKTMGDITLQENEYVMDLLMELSRERTKFLYEGIGVDTIRKIEDSRQPVEVVRILADESGVVTQINARTGSFAAPPAALFTLADVSRVWVTATLYPDQAEQVKIGDEVTIIGPGDRAIQSRLSFVNTVADSNKVSARMEIDNSQLHLRPGSFVGVTIHAQPHEALVVPGSAVLRSGDGNVVMLHRGEGQFLPVYVDTGIESSDSIEITDGLQPGAEVAVNGQFLLDSAASMNAAVERMQSHDHKSVIPAQAGIQQK
ncbi:MAG TPA: efflux RND transporter periplasmic adaptor subunit [Gallionella sp.]|nr:efflux RND transporter periplasmic adaptor subunit [Gallionella sp.]